MKKILTFSLLIFALMMGACSGPSADDVAKKLEEKKTIDKKEIVVMMDYCNEAIKDMTDMVKKGNVSEESSKKMEAKYPHASDFMLYIMTHEDEVKAADPDRFKSLQDAFTAYINSMQEMFQKEAQKAAVAPATETTTPVTDSTKN